MYKSINEKIQLESRIKLFIKRELETIFRSYSIGMIQCHIEGLLSSPEFCYLKLINDWSPHLGIYSHGPHIELFEHQIEPYLIQFTHHFTHELLLFCMSNVTQPDRYDELVEYEKKSLLNFKKDSINSSQATNNYY
ncbi:hypothetical protein C9374_000940 [Naegleria lovaniensis]|uniref:Uncharacterized protein n=1 Tax=Naegleria lovaniensis TaxID=51637 RepID=A0AA88KLP2_NAELO|nr:uncharacterized protein C9374_000940 [Naegleria lovaniensis]KAG2388090.1 hypothetical protein C9374_000940 [Naegleria lovaniensis]